MKCSKCEEEKPVSEYYCYTYKSEQRPFKHCKTCHKTSAAKWIANRPDRRRVYDAKKWYGITEDDLKKLYLQCKGRCGICQKTEQENERFLSIDHDHKSGIVRGLLCTECNHGLGKFKDNLDLLRNAVAYLEIPPN